MASIKAAPLTDANEIQRVTSKSSTKSRVSRIITNLTLKGKKARLAPAPLPLSDLDNGIVGWESQLDPEMPLNFADSRKWLLIALLAAITFISPFASSMFARTSNSHTNLLIFLMGAVLGARMIRCPCL